MSTSEMIKKIKGEEGQDTIIPEFQNPDTCVFCDDKSYDTFMFLVLRIYYHIRNRTGYEKKLDKETCIHHKDKWLRYSHRTAGFIWSAFTDYGKKPMTNGELLKIFGNKEERERLLTELYDRAKNFTCASHLYLTVPPENNKNRYSNAFTIEDDISVQNKIIQNKLKTYYTNATEVLQTYGDSYNS